MTVDVEANSGSRHGSEKTHLTDKTRQVLEKCVNNNRKSPSDIQTYCIGGALALGIHYGSYLLLKNWINLSIAFAIGYVTSVVGYYLLSTCFPFLAKKSIDYRVIFTCFHLFILLLQAFLFKVFLRLGMNDILTPFPVFAISAPASFFLARFVFLKQVIHYSQDSNSWLRITVILSLIIVLIVTIGLLPDWLQYGIFYMGGDFADQQIPFIVETKRMLSSGTPFWSWNTYLGQNFIASYSFYTLTSPFVWINCLFPYDLIPTSITITLYLKFICTGVFSLFYFREMHVSKLMALAGALLYTFSSFVVVNLNFYHFFEPLLCFPLLLLAFERFLKKRKYAFPLLAGISFLSAFINWYFIPCSFIALTLYAVCRVFGKEGIHISSKRILLAVSAVGTGILMSSFVLVPTLTYMAGGARTTPSFSLPTDQYEILIWLQQIRSLFIPKVEEAGNSSPWVFYSFGSSAATLPVLGVLGVVLYIIKKKDWLRTLLVISVIIFITPLNGIFSLFTNPFYSRWAYALSLFFVLASVKYLDDNKRIRTKELILYLFVAITVYLFFRFPVYWMHFKGFDTSTFSNFAVDLCILVVFSIDLLFLSLYQRKQTPQTLIVLISIFACFQLGVRIYERTDHFYSITDSAHSQVYQTYINSGMAHASQSMHYRVDYLTRENVIYANASLLNNTPSISTYNSVKDKNTSCLLSAADSTYYRHSHFVPAFNRSSFDALMSVKNIVEFKDSLARQAPVNEKTLLKQNSKYTEYSFDYFIPMGFTYDSYIPERDLLPLYENKPMPDIPKQLLANLVVDDRDVLLLEGNLSKGTLVSENAPLDSLINARKRIVCSSFLGNTKGFKATINLDRDNVVFFSVPADPGFSASVDGKKVPIIRANLGLSAVSVPRGKHLIVFRFTPPGLIAGLVISLIFTLVFCFSFFVVKKKR